MRIPFEQARQQLARVLMSRSCPADKAEKVAHEMARNSLEGIYTHGINRFARLIRNIDEGIVDVHARVERLGGFGAIEHADGHLGLGVVNASECMDRAIQLAERYGIGLVTLRNTNHWMRAATYGYQACERGMIGLCVTNTIPNMPTWGATDSRLGNNPLMIACPRAEGDLVVDMAMSQFSYGALELARLEGRRMPIDAGYSAEGQLTREPDEVIRSQRILPTGYWKGAGLSFLLDMLAGCLSMGNTVAQIGRLPGDEHGVSQLFCAISLQAAVPDGSWEEKMEAAVEDLLASSPAPGTERIIYPGQQTQEIRRENLAKGIPVDEGVWNTILSLG